MQLLWFPGRKSLQPEHSIDSNFPHDNHHQHIYNPNISFNNQETTPQKHQ